MKTPICDFVRDYAAGDALRLHMPGHKGRAVLGPEALDITEIDGADVLYHARGIIRESEANAAALFGAARTIYSAEGSTLCIRAMLYLALLHAREKGRAPVVLAGRNAHRSFVTAAALLGCDVRWLYPPRDAGLLSCPLDAEALDTALAGMVTPPAAVYVTSPDYLGNRLDIASLAAMCHEHKTLLLVDNAHGAYLRFLPHSEHPMQLGADMCCDSAHKMLPVLTGGAYLHISSTAPAELLPLAEQAMELFASTSPSYLILQSLDAANRTLAGDWPERMNALAECLTAVRARLAEAGYVLAGDEPLKLTVAPKGYGYTGTALAAALRERGMECEFADPDFAVMMFSPSLPEDAPERVERALLGLPCRNAVNFAPPPLPKPESVLTPREAMLAPRQRLDTARCLGRVLAAENVSCPPAVPVAVAGERLDRDALRCMAYYGVSDCWVVRE